MKFVIAAEDPTLTNLLLADAFAARGVETAILDSTALLREVCPGDAVLGRVDVALSLDGVQACIWRLRELGDRSVRLFNPPGALLAAHDKLLTALHLARLGIRQPRTAHLDGDAPLPPSLEFPVVVKPRFGSWGRDVVRCETPGELRACLRGARRKRWFRRQGALVQEFIPTAGRDLRLIVCGGEVVGSVSRLAANGEWRTNVALGGTRIPVDPPEEARELAIAAADAIHADLVGVDLLPCGDGHVVLELNGAADFTPEYSVGGRDVFGRIADSLTARWLTESVPLRG